MIVATELTAGEKPRCLECGAFASYIELHARFVSSCKHPFSGYATETQLAREFESAQTLANEAHARLVKWARLPIIPRHEMCYRGREPQACVGCTNAKYCEETATVRRVTDCDFLITAQTPDGEKAVRVSIRKS